jgi:hypothetical protein
VWTEVFTNRPAAWWSKPALNTPAAVIATAPGAARADLCSSPPLFSWESRWLAAGSNAIPVDPWASRQRHSRTLCRSRVPRTPRRRVCQREGGCVDPEAVVREIAALGGTAVTNNDSVAPAEDEIDR